MKAKSNSEIVITLYDNRANMTSDVLMHCVNLRNESNLLYHKFSIESGLDTKTQLSDYRSYFKDKNMRLWIATAKKNQVVGILEAYIDDRRTCHSKNHTYITSLYIKPEFRRLGIASKLVRRMYEDRKGSQFEIGVSDGNTQGISFWKSVGFTNPYYSHYVLDWNDCDEDD